ncbi:cation:proton antiporter [Yoonia sp. SDW83-1]|uniref:cation:proton antiporter n=1 Tax=Yoonia sp. SDW83-1 TaxID=3366945 RepID=UPI00398C4420
MTLDPAQTLLTLAGLFAVGLAADQIGHRTPLPRVTLLLICGILAGASGFDLIPSDVSDWYELLSIVALTMVAFLLGGSLTRKNLQSHGPAILLISVSVVVFTILIVGVGLALLGLDLGLALLLGAIATATAPAATQDVIRQSGVKNDFTDALQGIVAIDDVWGLFAFSVILVMVHQMNGSVEASILSGSIREFGGSVLLGILIGVPAALLTGRLSGGEPLQIEALALTFLTAGLAIMFELSYLISGMTVGAIIVNRARHHTKAFHEIEHIQWPFMILFFILAGASLDTHALLKVGFFGLAYVVLRVLSRLLGGWIGAALGKAPSRQRPWFGLALMPQAGVAIGMALVAAKQFPNWSETIIAVTIGTTIAFELLGPAVTLMAIRRTA